MNRRPRKMVPIVRNPRVMTHPIRVDKLSTSERVAMEIEQTESDMFMLIGDSPSPEVLASPALLHLQKRLALLNKKKENVDRTTKHRKRHLGTKEIRNA